MSRFEQAIVRIDAVHAEDPEQKELAYAKRMSTWLEKLDPNASEALRLAVRCQHLRRWSMARSAYSGGKVGYLQWRKASSIAHAALAGEILGLAGYDAETVKHVQSLIKKERIKHDPDAQLLEDCACLVFLEYEFAGFARKHEEEKLVDILQKSWGKMSARGQEAALALDLPRPLRLMVEKALTRSRQR